ncbi:response regulator [Loktanella sp. M215]|uniref:response regulator n=1 Tax=Loktanella sp. M215 TaxID=2675431 RepID=UPI001F00C61D|nr:response regulator [Loktanella sp. M215]MCF7701767.1 response regulator [Loktanella sp. M215]
MTTRHVSHNILIVEDEWLIALDMEMVIKDLGHTVIGPAANVAAALLLIERSEIDIAFLDISLGSEQSYPLADTLHDRKIPVTFLSAYTTMDLPSRFRDFDLLQKPVAAKDLSRQISKMLNT